MLTFVGFLYSYFFVLFCFVFVFVGANEMHSQLMVGACCVCICFICLLKVNNLLVFVSLGHVLVFCLGTCVSCWIIFVVQYIIQSFIHSLIHSFIQLHNALRKVMFITCKLITVLQYGQDLELQQSIWIRRFRTGVLTYRLSIHRPSRI